MAAGAGQRGQGVIEARNLPAAHPMAIGTQSVAANVGPGFAGRDFSVVAACAIFGNLRMIDRHVLPARRGVTIGTETGCWRMIDALARSRRAVVAGRAGLRRALEARAAVAGLAAHLDVLSRQFETGRAMVKGFVDADLGRCGAGERQHGGQAKSGQPEKSRSRVGAGGQRRSFRKVAEDARLPGQPVEVTRPNNYLRMTAVLKLEVAWQAAQSLPNAPRCTSCALWQE